MPTDEEIKDFLAGQNNQQNENSNQQSIQNYITHVQDGKFKYLTKMTEGWNKYQNIQTFSNIENDK